MRRLRASARWLGVVGAVVVWAGVSGTTLVPRLFLPTPSEVVLAARDGLANGSLLRNLLVSCGRISVAFSASLLVAVPTSLLIARSPVVGSAIESLVDFLRYIPVPALIPISIVFFGVDEQEKVFLLFAGTYFQIVVLVVDAYGRIPSEYFDIFYSLRLTEREIVMHLLRASAPDVLDICRVTLGWCWSYVVLAEVIGADSGIGYALELAQRFSNTPAIYLWMILLASLGLITDLAFRRLSGAIFRYRDGNGSTKGGVAEAPV